MPTWNGYVVTPYVLNRTPPAHVKALCYAVKRCVHGPTCRRCCHPFTRLDLLDSNYLINVKPDSTRPWLSKMAMRRFFWEVQYGQLVRRPRNAVIYRLCDDPMCMNLLHLARGRTSDITGFWQGVRVCVHGRDCRDCCWDWKASFHKHTLTISGRYHGLVKAKNPETGQLVCIYTHRVAYFYTFGVWPSRSTLAYHICESDGRCCNPFHVRFIAKSLMFSECHALLKAQKRTKRHLRLLEAA